MRRRKFITHSIATTVVAASAYAILVMPTVARATGAPFEFRQVKPTLQIEIPNLRFSDIRARTIEGEPTDVSIPWIGEYIAAIYRWAVPVGAVLATIVIMVAGVIWLTSGGAGALSTAKDWITNAVIGLLLLVGSYVVLNIINPDLVRLQALRIAIIQPINVDFTATENTIPAGDVAGGPPAAPGFNNVPTFKQGQPPWGQQPYGACPGNPTFGSSACGASSFAMVLKHYGVNTDPTAVGTYAVANGYRPCGHGTSPKLWIEVDRNPQWSNMTGAQVSRRKALELLRQGKPIIFVTPKIEQCYKQNGHYMVATGVDPEGRVRVNDPARCGRKFGGYNGQDGVWADGSGVGGVTALTQEKFFQGGVGWYVHPR